MNDDNFDIKHDKIFRFVFLFMFFAYPVSSYVTEFLGLSTGILSIITRALQVVVVITYSFYLFMQRRLRLTFIQPVLFIFFWLLYIIRVIVDTTLHGNQLGFPVYQYYLFGIVLSFFCTLPLFSAAPVNEVKLEKQVFLISILLTILAIYNTVNNAELFITRLGGNERLNPITTSIIATYPLLVAIKRLFFEAKKNLLMIIIYFACIPICIVALLIVSTKVMFICIPLIMVLMFYEMAKQKKVGAIAAVLAFFTLVIAIIVFGGYADYFRLSIIRFTEIGQDQSSQDRIDLLNGAIAQIRQSPIVGSFLEEKIFKFYPHNLVVESFMTTGIIGGSIFLIFYLIFLVQIFLLVLRTKFGIVSLVTFAYCLLALTSSSITFSPEFWYSTAIVSWMFAKSQSTAQYRMQFTPSADPNYTQ